MEELAFELDRVGAAQKCEQLMTTYVSLHMEMRHKDYLRLWTQRPDCKLEMPWEPMRLCGRERCYLKDHGDRSMPEIQELLKGLLCVHTIGTSVIEVAADGKTAQGVWISRAWRRQMRARMAPWECGVEQVRRGFSAGRGRLEDLEDEGLSAVSGRHLLDGCAAL